MVVRGGGLNLVDWLFAAQVVGRGRSILNSRSHARSQVVRKLVPPVRALVGQVLGRLVVLAAVKHRRVLLLLPPLLAEDADERAFLAEARVLLKNLVVLRLV